MSRQLLCVILLLQFHACFASRGLVVFHDKLHHSLHEKELLGSKEEKERLTLKCRMNTEHCMEAILEGTKGAFEGSDSKLEKQKKKRMLQMVEARATHGYNSTDDEAGEDIEVKDYAQPQRKPPIHNDRP